MELLDRANTETFGNPVPVAVPLSVEKGPFIVITGFLPTLIRDLKISASEGELRYRMAESAEGIRGSACANPVYNQLLGIRDIRLGPTLPAFLSPNVLKFLAENFKLAPATTPEQDLEAILGKQD